MSLTPDNIGMYVSDVMPRLDGVYLKNWDNNFF